MVEVEELEDGNSVTGADDVVHDVVPDVSDPLLPRKPRKRRSPVWKEFLVIGGSLTIDGKERATCFHCKTATFIADSHYGTKNLHMHLAKYNAYKTSLTRNDRVQVFDQMFYRELVARAIIKHGYAFSWVEHSANMLIHTYLNNQVKTITRNTAKADCLKLHKSLKADLVNILKHVPGRIFLTADMWTSCTTEGYLCLTAHYVDASWTLSSKVLNFCNIETPHTGYEMYSVVSGLLKKWDIENKIFSITLDNASSNDKMQDYLRESLVDRGLLLNKGCFFHVRCAAHVLNLIVHDGLNMVKHIIRKIRISVKYVKHSESRKRNFKLCATLAAITETKALCLDVSTRWNSTFMMLDRAILYRAAFKELKNKDTLYKYFPEPDEWDKIEKVRDVLEPFCDIINLFSGSDYPTSNLYFENVWRIAMLLKDMVDGEDSDLRIMGRCMQDKFDKYWLYPDGDDYNTLFAFAMILDPRYKKQTLKYCYEKIFEDDGKAHLKVNDVLFKLERLLNDYTTSEHTILAQNPSLPSEKSSNRKRKFDLRNIENEESVCATPMKSMLDVYLEDGKLDRNVNLNILEFWKVNKSKYGELAHLARDILTVPLTTVASESTFSIGGRILNKWRSSYLPENVEALITFRSWLHGYEVNDEDTTTKLVFQSVLQNSHQISMATPN
ncbi:hypothetical protein RND81_06G054700 [Saponaria officinalis]|uniref:Transposase n=1 Tax=Saponaria officinalis TaxID=3572 RepID=A0AAW1K7E3_SAPOF